MLSPFLKKLLFVRQFSIDKGQIDILGQNQIMLPSDLIAELQIIDHDKVYNIVKKHITVSMESYAKRIGSSTTGIIKSSQDIFETFGLGQFQILKLDNPKKIANITILKSSICDSCKKLKLKKEGCLLEAALAGMFAFLFKTEVTVETKGSKQGNIQFLIKKR